MEEEIRNLKVTKELFDQIRLCQSCGATILNTSVWKDAELAPPKDWRPLCFVDSDGLLCDVGNRYKDETCIICPYRRRV